jgi:acetate kinase
MGFTALDGLPMGTRSGQIDPGVLLYLLTEKAMSAAEIENLLYHESGLKGLSGISNDMRALETSDSRLPRWRSTISFTVSDFMQECSRLRSAGLMRLSSPPVSGKIRP